MLGAVATMWDSLGWGGETQALIYNPKTKKVIGINALGVAPTGATPEFYRRKDAVSAGVRPARGGHTGHARRPDGDARRVRHACLAEVLAPAIQMADGYPIEAQAADAIEPQKARSRSGLTRRR